MKKSLIAILIFWAVPVLATDYTVCSSGCDETTIQAVLDTNAIGGSIEKNDDMQDDDTGDWQVFRGTVTFSTDHYVWAHVDAGTKYIGLDGTFAAGDYMVMYDAKNGAASSVGIWAYFGVGFGSLESSASYVTTASWVSVARPITLSGAKTRVGLYSTMSAGDVQIRNFRVSKLYQQSDTIEVQASTVGGSSTYREKVIFGPDDTGDSTYGMTLQARSGDTVIISGASVIVGGNWSKTGGQTNVYEASYALCSSCESMLWEDDTILSEVANVATVDSTDASFYHDTGASTIYVNATGASNDPSSNGKTYEVPAQTECIDDNDQEYWTIDGIDCTKTYGTDATIGGIMLTGSNNTVQNLSSYSHRRHGISFYTGADNGLIDNVTAYESTSTAVIAVFNTNTSTNTIQNSTIYNSFDSGSSVNSGIVIHGGADDTTIQDNIIRDAGVDPDGAFLITAYTSGTTNIIVRRNQFSGAHYNAVKAQDITGLEVYYNSFDSLEAENSIIYLDTSTGSEIYSNSIYADSSAMSIIMLDSATGTIVKNNIIHAYKYISVSANSVTNTDIDYNLYYNGSGSYFNWSGTNYATWADWLSNSSQDANSPTSQDPKFKDAANGDLSLMSGSPGIDSGLPPNESYYQFGNWQDLAGKKFVTWKALDIGAYEYQKTKRFLKIGPWRLQKCGSTNPNCYDQP